MNSIDKDIEYIRAMLDFKKWERALKDETPKKREMILRGYGIRSPKTAGLNITIRALEDGTP